MVYIPLIHIPHILENQRADHSLGSSAPNQNISKDIYHPLGSSYPQIEPPFYFLSIEMYGFHKNSHVFFPLDWLSRATDVAWWTSTVLCLSPKPEMVRTGWSEQMDETPAISHHFVAKSMQKMRFKPMTEYTLW